jgi:hypothetical protein
MQLRAMLSELGMPSISSLFPVPKIQDAFGEDGAALDPAWDVRFAKFAIELEWYANALRDARSKGAMEPESVSHDQAYHAEGNHMCRASALRDKLVAGRVR